MSQISQEELLAFVGEARARVAGWNAEEPHSVVQVDPETGAVQTFGPYPNAYAALDAVYALQQEHAQHTGPPLLEYKIGLHFPPEDVTRYFRPAGPT